MEDSGLPLRRRAAAIISFRAPANDAGEPALALDDVLRRDANLIRAVRESRAFAVDLASALFGVPFVHVTRDGGVNSRVPAWSCTAWQAAALVAEMRGMGEDPREFLDSLDPTLIIRNTATEIEDHINRLGWCVW
jgi:hypothetical protein